ncbi:MAG: pirin family protein [Bdellovibrionaceae bacterium]|nr:pirin family protein [Pseudobdellovibrionaceae bacterium]
MFMLRKSNDRGAADHGWLHAKHTFSFANYYDDAHMGFRSLRVINEDRVDPQQGFPTHAHRDMEILTYVISGGLEHKDSMGNGSVIRPGDVQYMSAGHGVRHSEFNHSNKESVHLLQIWILPDKANYEPTYDQMTFPKETRKNNLKLVATGDSKRAKEHGAILIRRDADLYASVLDAGQALEHKMDIERGAWLQLVHGQLTVNGTSMVAGDGLRIENEGSIKILSEQTAEFLLFDLD